MRHLRLPILLAAVAAFASLAERLAASEERTEVIGVVVDPSGAAVPDATVTAWREQTGLRASCRTDASGRFRLELPVGDYELSTGAAGFSVSHRTAHLPADGEIRLTLRYGVFTEEVTVVGTRLLGGVETIGRLPGSVDSVDSRQMEASRVLNVSETLRKASGLHVRDEEGFALRPNIGIRGLNPTRSTKTLLLEDGLFLTFAPYGDNATYYHPPVERFESIEILKGAGQIAYGPVTVGGVVNYLTPNPPARPSATLRLAGGNRDYLNGLASAGGTFGRTAVLAEVMRKQGDGARDNVHSEVDDVNLKAVFTLTPRHSLTFKGNYYGEDSQVTYSGLTTAEYAQAPRQNPFVNDSFDGRRLGGSLKHTWLAGGQSLLVTQVYGSRFSRDWWRQSSNSTQRPNDRSDPECGGMANLLTTCGNEGRLRDYDHFGVEPRLRTSLTFLGLRSEAEVGARAHFEVQERLQENGATPLSRTGARMEDNRRENQAYSAFAQDRLLLGDFTVSAGVRFESVRYERTNRLANAGRGATGSTDVTQWVPGGGVSWSPNPQWSVFTGLHRGFAPPRTEDIVSQSGGVVDLDAELSWNYELGVRGLPLPGLRFDATYFRNDFENQVVPASLAGGVGAVLANGGETLHEGFELSARVDSAAWRRSDQNLYLRAALTSLPVARLQGLRFSSVAGSSSVSVSGNRIPYTPEMLLTAALGYAHPRGVTLQLEAVHVSEQFADDLNTAAASIDGQRGLIPAHTIWNASASLEVRALKSSFFVTAKNLLDETYVVDRSRGILPGPPRLVQVGLVTRF